jgi:hypothetical protein
VLRYEQVTKLDRVIGSHITEDRHNTQAMVALLTRSIGPRMPDIIDELLISLQTLIPPSDGAQALLTVFVVLLILDGQYRLG